MYVEPSIQATWVGGVLPSDISALLGVSLSDSAVKGDRRRGLKSLWPHNFLRIELPRPSSSITALSEILHASEKVWDKAKTNTSTFKALDAFVMLNYCQAPTNITITLHSSDCRLLVSSGLTIGLEIYRSDDAEGERDVDEIELFFTAKEGGVRQDFNRLIMHRGLADENYADLGAEIENVLNSQFVAAGASGGLLEIRHTTSHHQNVALDDCTLRGLATAALDVQFVFSSGRTNTLKNLE